MLTARTKTIERTGTGRQFPPSLASLSATKFSLQIYMELTAPPLYHVQHCSTLYYLLRHTLTILKPQWFSLRRRLQHMFYHSATQATMVGISEFPAIILAIHCISCQFPSKKDFHFSCQSPIFPFARKFPGKWKLCYVLTHAKE